MASRKLELVFTGDTRALERAFGRLGKQTTAAHRSFGLLAKGAAAAGAAIGTGLAAAAVIGTKELIEQEKVSARTANVLKTTAGAANVTAKQVEALAAALQKQTGTADDAIQAGANLLLTFTNIRNETGKGNDIFNQSVGIVNDLSTALGQDMKSSAIQVGKALNDPITGLTALRRVGVSFTAEQKEQIKALTESGRTLDAQKIILRELNREFGGAAASEGKTTEAVQRMQRRFEDLTESLAAKLLPVFDKVASWIERNWPEIERTTRRVFEGVRQAIEVAVRWIEANVVPTIRSIVRNAKRFWDAFGDDITTIFNFIRRQIERALKIIGAVIKGVMAVLRGDWREAWNNLKVIVQEVFGGLLDWLRTIPKALLNLGIEMGKAIGRGILAGLKSIGGSIRDFLMSLIPGPLRRFFGGGTSTAAAVADLGRFGIPTRAMGGGIPGVPGQAVPIMAHAGEVVLNPAQQRIVGIDRIAGALRSTGGVVGGRMFDRGGYVSAARQRAVSNLGEPYGKPSRGQSRTGPSSWDCSGFATMIAGVNVGGTTASAYAQSSPAKGGEPIVWGFRKSHSGGYRGGYDEHMGVRVGGIWYQTSGGQTAQTGSDSEWSEIRVPNGLGNLTDGDGSELTRSIASVGGGGTAKALTPLQRLTRALGAGGFNKPGMTARGIMAAGAGDPAGGVAGASFTPAQSRGIASAGRKAAREELAKGGPDAVQRAAEARDDAERTASIGALRKNLKKVQALIRKLQRSRKQKFRQIQAAGRRKGLTRGQRQTIIGELRAARRRLKEDIDGLREVEKAVVEELRELQYQAELDRLEDAESDEGGEGPTAEDAAAAYEAAENAEMDILAGEAALTPGLDDDLAAARTREAIAQRRLDDARALGDRALIAQRLGELLSARQNRESIEATMANTDALNANTDAMKQAFGGSVSFGYRGQSYVLGSLAPPSSDRLTGAEVGI